MGRVRGLQGVAALLARASVANGAKSVGVSELAASRTSYRCLSGDAPCSFHACRTPIAIGSPIRGLWKGVSAANTVWARHISAEALQPSDTFAFRHNSASEEDVAEMVKATGFGSIDELIEATVPKAIKRKTVMDMGKYTNGYTESGFLSMFKKMASKNKVNKTYIGMGYYNTMLPPVIARNLLENPGWYTQYTPYQAEIAQGRLESLLNFQTMVCDLTGMPMSNSSLLDEATAAAEAMTMCTALSRQKKLKFLVSDKVHPQTIAVLQSRADGLGLTVEVGDEANFNVDKDVSGVLVQYPATDGTVHDYKDLVAKTQEAKAKLVVATDLLACTMLTPPGEWGADIVIGSAQRFGVPMGYGGPHAAFLACANENKRLMPGRIIGVSRDVNGKEALRMAMQTREQHIRRDKATSNICTAQALLANISAMFAVYHGPKGLTTIAERVNGLACVLAEGSRKLGHKVASEPFFDTVRLEVGNADQVLQQALKAGVNLRKLDSSSVSIALDETTMIEDVDTLFSILNGGSKPNFDALSLAEKVQAGVGSFKRSTPFLEHEIFNLYQSEHEMLRYLKRLENKDLSLTHSMIALGSCTMKLNATSEMIPISWPELANLHPFVPLDQAEGYQEMFEDLAQQLAVITGFDSVSLQPNSGAAGEYAGLMAIRGFHKSNNEGHRNVCIIPTSAHGTNPASAVMAGMKVVTTGVDSKGNIDMAQLRKKAEEHKDKLGALMVTYPSTHGVYEEGIDEICNVIHENGGQVYMDGANMNAQVGLTAPGIIGADVCHLNLHKTFCIPHGGGGPGMGPIGVKSHLAPFLPTHPVIPTGAYPNFKSDEQSCGTLASAPYGSALILPISYAYISMMGSHGLTQAGAKQIMRLQASMRAILNANYMAKRLEKSYPILYKGNNGTCAHEFILDIRSLKDSAGIEPEDIAKRLIDYGFHAPTMSWPVPGTLMVEPTESESKAELDRFCNAMIAIREEIKDIEDGKAEKGNNAVSNSPHPADEVLSDKWDKPYSRELAAYPAAWCRQAKFWPTTSRVDNVYGDKHLVSRLPEASSAFAVAVGERLQTFMRLRWSLKELAVRLSWYTSQAIKS